MDPKTLPFPTIGELDLLADLFKFLALYMYARHEFKPRMLLTLSNSTKYSSFNRFYWTDATIPSTVTQLIELYFKQPIVQQDRTEFLDIYMIPFMGTGKRLKNLYDINPVVFTPVLDALIHSKRIQRIISQPNILTNISLDLKNMPSLVREGAVEDYETEANTLRSLLLVKYEEQEQVIANRFIQAQLNEPNFLAPEDVMKAKIAANAARRKRKSRRGGKRHTRKVSSLRRRR